MSNREIKFRIWNGISKRWLLNTDWEFYSNFDYIYPKILLGYHIQQFTGLKDKNGREIYEGDILKSNNRIGHVEYYYESFTINLGEENLIPIWKGWEIIGNIFETPELLNNE